MPDARIETLVILGAGGDLASRLLLPGLASLLASTRGEHLQLIGVDRGEISDWLVWGTPAAVLVVVGIVAGFRTSGTRRAVLFQGGKQRDSFDLTDPKQLSALLNEFYAWTDPEIENFQQAVDGTLKPFPLKWIEIEGVPLSYRVEDKMRLTNSKGLLMGTPFYMSPEASQGLEMTSLSDQYALGVVLYEAATGTNPFSGASTFGEVVRQVGETVHVAPSRGRRARSARAPRSRRCPPRGTARAAVAEHRRRPALR